MLPTIPPPLGSVAPGASTAAPGSGPAMAACHPLPSGSVASSPAHRPDAFVLATAAGPLAPAIAPRARRPRAAAAGYAAAPGAASAAGKTGADAAKKAGPLAFLSDRSLSVEEKLMRLLAHLSDRWDKDIEKKMKEIEAGQQKAPAASGTEKKKSGGILGSLGEIARTASGFFPAVGFALEALKNPAVRAVASRIGGPVLAAAATAVGYPSLAPLLLKYGPAVIDAAAGVATSLDAGSSTAGGTSGAAASAAGSGSSPSATGMNDSELRLKVMEIERIQNLQKEMFTLVSNILRAGHETRMNVIQNVR